MLRSWLTSLKERKQVLLLRLLDQPDEVLKGWSEPFPAFLVFGRNRRSRSAKHGLGNLFFPHCSTARPSEQARWSIARTIERTCRSSGEAELQLFCSRASILGEGLAWPCLLVQTNRLAFSFARSDIQAWGWSAVPAFLLCFSALVRKKGSGFVGKRVHWIEAMARCNMFYGNWVRDESYLLYPEGSCPHIDEYIVLQLLPQRPPW